MADSGGEMEAPTVRKWPEAIMWDEIEREYRERLLRNEEERGSVLVLVFGVIIIDGFFVDNMQTDHCLARILNFKCR